MQNCSLKTTDYNSPNLYTWCTNCGNYGIHAAVKRALVAENIAPKDVVMTFDVGCNGNGADKIGGNIFHGLHGRSIPLATGIALANRRLKVISFGGDGGTFSEGIGHLIHAIRSNYNITFILHNNCNYALTTGQASSTTPHEMGMNSSPDGNPADTLNTMNMILNLNPSFAARSFSGDVKHMTEIIRQGLQHKGFSYIEILQSCPTYNRVTTHEWYMNNIYDVSVIQDGYDKRNLDWARSIVRDGVEKIAIGVLYQDDIRPDFYARQQNRIGIESELVDEVAKVDIRELVEKFR